MNKADVFSAKGVKKASLKLPSDFNEEINMPLLAQAVRVYEARRHPGVSKVKTRGEVTASTRKIWRQKGIGRARHGAVSAPIFVGGGVAHGPKGVKRQLFLPKKMKKKALKIALSLAAKKQRIAIVEGVSSLKKTKEAKNLVDKIFGAQKKTPPRATFVLAQKNWGAERAIRNLPNAEVVSFEKLNAYNVFFGGFLILDKEILSAPKEKETKDKKEEKNK